MFARSAHCRRSAPAGREGFTVVELLVILGILIVLISIFIPYLLSRWEASNRARCTDNLRQIKAALDAYALDNDHSYPSVKYDPANRPQGYVVYTGIDDPDPFDDNTTVQPNDVTASLWLLVRRSLIKDPIVFICPSTSDLADSITDAVGRPVHPSQRSNFRGPKHLSYSYASPFSNAAGYRLNSDWLHTAFALMADKNPGVRGDDDDVTAPAYNAASMARANSHNHRRAGQNVLYPVGGGVFFRTTPYSGVGYPDTSLERDNLYTARALRTATQPVNLPVYINGFCGPDLSPAAPDDSFLVPTDDDPISPPAPPRPPSTAPVSTPSSL